MDDDVAEEEAVARTMEKVEAVNSGPIQTSASSGVVAMVVAGQAVGDKDEAFLLQLYSQQKLLGVYACLIWRFSRIMLSPP